MTGSSHRVHVGRPEELRLLIEIQVYPPFQLYEAGASVYFKSARLCILTKYKENNNFQGVGADK